MRGVLDGESPLRFESLISGISARFVDIPPEHVDPEIQRALEELLAFFRVDRCGLLSATNRQLFQITHVASADGLPSVPLNVDLPTALFPWVASQLLDHGEVVITDSLESLPPEADFDRKQWTDWNVKSSLDIPVITTNSSHHWIVIQGISRQITWPREYIPRVRLLGEILVNALQKKQKDQAIQRLLQFERLVASISARFVNIAVDRVDEEIQKALRDVLDFYEVDQCSLGLVAADRRSYQITHAAFGDGIPPRPLNTPIPVEMFPWCVRQLIEHGEYVVESTEDLPPEASSDRESWAKAGIRSSVSVLLGPSGSHCIAINTMIRRLSWPKECMPRLRLFGEILVSAMNNKQKDAEVLELKRRLERENVYLRSETRFSEDTEIIGRSAGMQKIMKLIHQVAPTESTVLLLGETGTGKELVAHAIHKHSRRKDRLMVRVNCASLPGELIESELFGREKGAYTGALAKQIGRFELADHSTLLLDEIGELPLGLQSKLLRVLESGEFERLGSPQTVRVDVRIVASTNRNLQEAVATGKFREDLYYRLKVFPIVLPPLRERPDDIPLMVRAFVSEFCSNLGRQAPDIPAETMQSLQAHNWPGNVRELRNMIEQAMILYEGGRFEVPLPQKPAAATGPTGPLTLEEMECHHILSVLEECRWRIKGRNGAAEKLGLKPSTLYTKMERLGIRNRPTQS